MVISSRSLFNLFLPYECMHIVLSFIGVILQSGSGVFSQRVYIAHDWLSWFHSRHSCIPCCINWSWALFISLQGKWALTNGDDTNITLFWVWEKGGGHGAVFHFFLTLYTGIILVSTKIIPQTPGDYCIKGWWIAVLKKPENLLSCIYSHVGKEWVKFWLGMILWSYWQRQSVESQNHRS